MPTPPFFAAWSLPRRLSGIMAVCLAWPLFALSLHAAPASIDVQTIGSRTQRLLDQADSLLEDEQWADAIETLTLILSDSHGHVASVDGGRYVPLSDVCHARLLQLPPAALADLRREIDPAAEQLLDQGKRTRDTHLLGRLVRERFLSSHTPDALLLLSELLIERGDYAAARAALGRVHPLCTGPSGKPVGIVLAQVDLKQRGDSVLEVLRAPKTLAPPVCLPEDHHLPRALAKLALISTLELDFERAEVEINLLKLVAPHATGNLGGQDAVLVETLETLLASARTWPAPAMPSSSATLGGNHQRSGAAAPVGNLAAPIWPKPFQQTPVARSRIQRRSTVIINGRRIVVPQSEPTQPPSRPFPETYPCIYGRWVVIRDRSVVLARDLLTGKPAVTQSGKLDVGGTLPTTNQAQSMLLNRRNQMQLMRRGIASFPLELGADAMSVVDGVLFARIGPRSTTPNKQKPGLLPFHHGIVGLSLVQEGLEVADLSLPAPPWRFSGPPLVEEGLAYVALEAVEARPRLAVACYAIASGEPLWTTSIGSGAPTTSSANARPADVLTKAGATIFINTNLGGVASLEASSGRINWIAEYPRTDPSRGPTTHQANAPAPCIYYRGRVFASPTDSKHTFAIDASSGRMIWASDRPGGGVQLLGARGNRLIATGQTFTALDTNTGQALQQWPRSSRSGIRGMGRGCIAGDEVFWPTRNSIYTLSATTGQMTRPPIDLSPVGASGANLTPSHGLLVVAGPEKLTVYGPYKPKSLAATPESSQPDKGKTPPR